MALVVNGDSRGIGVVTLGSLVSRILNLEKKPGATR
jgi:hypothetical protein